MADISHEIVVTILWPAIGCQQQVYQPTGAAPNAIGKRIIRCSPRCSCRLKWITVLVIHRNQNNQVLALLIAIILPELDDGLLRQCCHLGGTPLTQLLSHAMQSSSSLNR